MFPNVKHISALVRNKRVVDHLEDVTIMFSDLKGYTEWASTESPREVYRVLNKVVILCLFCSLFTRFPFGISILPNI